MSLFPRLYSSSFRPSSHELGPFFNLFNDTFSELQKISDSAAVSRTFAPKFDVKEAQDKYTLEGELPGIDPKDVTMEFVDDGQTLTIKGRTERVKEEGQRPPTETTMTGANAEGGQETPATSAEGQEVSITGAQEVAKHEPQHTYWMSERSVGEFARSFSFPVRVDQENVKASLKNGILSVVVPKMQRANNASKRIQIDAE